MSICHFPIKAQKQLTRDKLSQVVLAEEHKEYLWHRTICRGSEGEWEIPSVPFAVAAEGTACR